MKKKSNNNAMGIGKLKKFLILAFSIIVAAALVVTGILCFNPSKKSPTDEVESGDVEASAVTTFDAKAKWGRTVNLATNIQNGTVKEGDIINFPFIATGAASGPSGAVSNNGFWPWNNGEYTVTLPQGTYKIQLWGAQGGGAGNGAGRSQGGYGGYATVTLKLTSATTLYLNVGGVGEGTAYRCIGSGYSSAGGGGYNGGGSVLAGGGSISSASHGGAGGGATHIATSSGLLSAFSATANRAKVLLVAGGGGGGSHDSLPITQYKGCGGGTTGQEAANQGTYASYVHGLGGTQTAGGALSSGVNGGQSGENVNSRATAGGFGQGGRGGSWGNGGGGGGGGWFGGSGGSIQGGGGGSGHIGTDSRLSAGQLIAGGSSNANPVSNATLYTAYATSIPNPTGSGNIKGQTGNGYAKITVVNCNDVPVSQNISKGPFARQTGLNLELTTSNIATDPENQDMFFSNGVASSIDTVTQSGFKLYLNSACTTAATNYVSWSLLADNKIRIDEIKRYPRAGIDGVTTNGKLTLYAWVRDSFATTSERGYSAIPFTLNVSDNSIYAVDTSNIDATATHAVAGTGDGTYAKITDSDKNYVEYTYGSGASLYNYRVGASDMTDETYDYVHNGHIYNTAPGMKTVFIPQPLSPSRAADGFKVYAADVFGDLDDKDKGYDIVGIKEVATSASASAFYTLTYNSEAGASFDPTSHLSGSITIKPTNQRPTEAIYVSVKITAQSYEKATSKAIGNEYKDVTLVFRIANTRPLYASAVDAAAQNLNEPLVKLNVGESKTLDQTFLSTFLYDPDSTSPTYTFATSDGIKIPEYEYIAVNRENSLIALNSALFPGNSLNQDSHIKADSYKTGEGDVATGFKTRTLAQQGSAAASTACITYSYDVNGNLVLTGRAATQYQYSSPTRVNDRDSDLYIMVRVVDSGDVGDDGIWFPIPIRVVPTEAADLNPSASFTLSFHDYQSQTSTADASVTLTDADTATLTPLSYTMFNGTVNGIGAGSQECGAAENHIYFPFVNDADAFSYGSDSSYYQSELNDVVAIKTSDPVNYHNTEEFVRVELVDMYAPRAVFSGLTGEQLTKLGISQVTTEVYTFKGIKLIPLRSTDNYYYRVGINVVDSHGAESEVGVYVKVENRSINNRTSRTDTGYPISKAYGGVYVNNALTGSNSVNYVMEKGQTLKLTPYDFAYDFDTASEKNIVVNDNIANSDFGAWQGYLSNTNPSQSGFSATQDRILKKYNVTRKDSPNGVPETTDVTTGLLTFADPAVFNNAVNNHSGYISGGIRAASNTETPYVPYIEITADGRTSASEIMLSFTVTDGYSSISCTIAITIQNAAPDLLDTVKGNYYRLSAVPHLGESEITVNYYDFTLDDLAYDIDGDAIEFVPGSVRVVAKGADGNYYTGVRYDTVNNKYLGLTDADADSIPGVSVIKFTEFFTAVLGKNISGQDIIKIEAKSSTQLVPYQVYFEFKAVDSYRAQPREETLHVQIEVMNSKPEFIEDDLTKIGTGNSLQDTWYINAQTDAAVSATRYIINSKELYDSNIISAAPANKLLLFSDPDALQTAILDPTNGYPSALSALVESVSAIGSGFTPGSGAAVSYINPYPDNPSDFTVSIQFYNKVGSAFETARDSVVKDGKYWAIVIKDTGGSKPTVHFSISIKDETNGKKLYEGGRTETTSTPSDTAACYSNFYIAYQPRGLEIMHEKYRTDGNAEAGIAIDGTSYQVDLAKSHLQTTHFVDKKIPANQEALKTAKFTDDFRYQYFLNLKGSGEVSKYFPDDPFYYKPVEIRGGVEGDNNPNPTSYVPVSYLAMPSGELNDGTKTGKGTYVTLGNAIYMTSNASDENDQKASFDAAKNLSDAAYYDWNGTVDNKFDLIMNNVTLSYGNQTWSGSTLNGNPYIEIGYTAVAEEGAASSIGGEYVNNKRYRFTDTGVQKLGSEISYREDKFGFTLTRKKDAPRPTGNLKLTVKLRAVTVTVEDGKTKISHSSPQDVSVDLIVEDSRPSVTEANGATVSIEMSASEVNGRYIELVRNDAGNSELIKQDGIDSSNLTTIVFRDNDSTDVMKFLMASATSGTLGENMTSAELSHLLNKSCAGTSLSLMEYFQTKSTQDAEKITVAEAANLPINPNYETFFTVTPGTGASSSIQIKPTAKTQLNFGSKTDAEKDEYLAANHLEADEKTDGTKNYDSIYYPFRIICFDDIGDMGLTNAMWYPVTIKVYIVNDTLSLAQGMNTLDGQLDRTPIAGTTETSKDGIYSFSVGYNAGGQNKYTVDVARLLSDNDMVTKLKGSYNVPVVESDDAWRALLNAAAQGDLVIHAESDGSKKYNYNLIKDYLVMPAVTNNVPAHDVTSGLIEISGTKSSPVSVTVDPSDATTLIFEAASAFKDPVRMRLVFSDSVGTQQAIVFVISYSNTAPRVNPDTYSGSETLNIVMKAGDSFTLYAADATTFANDTKGGFGSPAEFDRAKTDPKTQIGTYPTDNAQTLRSGFKFYVMDTTGGGTAYPDSPTFVTGGGAANKGSNVGFLGSLIVGNDDAPSTLRFVERSDARGKAGVFTDSRNDYRFNVVAGHYLSIEGHSNGNNSQPMSVTITATGVVTNAEYRLTLRDDQGNTKELKFYLTVLSSEPIVKDVAGNKYDGFDVTRRGQEYDISLKYGDVFTIPLNEFMEDADSNDSDKFRIPTIYDNSGFKIVNPVNTPRAVSVSQVKDGELNALRIEATDFIADSNEKTTVTFRVADEHGAQSEEITFNVTIKPRDVKLIADNRENAVKVTVASYKDYVNGADTEVVDLVSATEKGAVVFDPDSSAPSALYNVKVYALNEKITGADGKPAIGTIEPSEITEDSLIAQCIQAYDGNPAVNGSGTDTASGSVYEYVNKFFSISLSNDGKQMTLTPNSATIDASEKFDSPIELYIVISKAYSNNGSYAMGEVNAHVHVSVDNSDPITVKSSSVNYGYGLKEIVGNDGGKSYEETTRREPFLSFTGSSGDEMIWYLYNKNNRNRGLFYDYDQINTGYEGTETLRYMSAEVLRKNVDGDDVDDDARKLTSTVLSGTELQPVFSISPVDNDKVKIKINRKVIFAQPTGNQGAPDHTDVTIRIYVADSLNYYSDEKTTFFTDINVRIENDEPEFKTVTPDDNKGYTVTYSAAEGYQMYASVRTGETLNVNLTDILEDADIKFDAYYFVNTGDSNCLTTDTKYVTGRRYGSDTSDSELFAFTVVNGASAFQIQTMTGFRFRCTSDNRGAIGICVLQLQDSTKQQTAVTSRMTIYLTVGNTAPTAKSDNIVIDVMGVKLGGDTSAPAGVYNIIQYVDDINPNDRVDATVEGNTSDTYVYIDAINVYQLGNGVEEPIIYGDGVIKEPIVDPDDPMGGGTPATTQVCNITWADNDTHQTFQIGLTPGVFGTQKVVFTVMDSGYLDGSISGITDGLSYQLNVTIIVSRPLDDFDIPTFEIARSVTREVTPEILLNAGSGEHNADGYVIKDIKSETSSCTPSSTSESTETSSVSASAADSTKWFIKAGSVVDPNAKITVTFGVGGKDYVQDVNVRVTENTAPQLLQSDNLGIFSLADLNSNNVITIRPERWFTDPDIGDVMRFVGPAKVKASAYAEANIDGDNIVIIFKGRGNTQLSFNITDATNELHAHTITIGCTDMPKLGLWQTFVASIQSNPLMYGIIFGIILLLIILLIIILVIVHRKRKMRAEIEALLASETELQEDLFRLSMGAQYQSFGYLPPAQTIQNPSLMLGNPNVAQNNTALQLGAGQGTSPNVQNPDDIVKYPQTGPRANAQQQMQQPQQPMNNGYGASQQQPPMNNNRFAQGPAQQPGNPYGNGGQNPFGGAQQANPFAQPQQGAMTPPPPPQNPYGVQQNVMTPPPQQQNPFAAPQQQNPFGSQPAEDSFGNPIGGNDGFNPDEF